MPDGNVIPTYAYVLAENDPPNPKDEVSWFREARNPGHKGCLFAARVRATTNDPRFPVGGVVVFDWETPIKDGDIIVAQCFSKDRPDGLIRRALTFIHGSSLRGGQFMDWLRERGWDWRAPELRTYVLRRYVEVGDSFRLETLDGTGLALEKSSTVDLITYAVATTMRPWGWSRDLVMVGGEAKSRAEVAR